VARPDADLSLREAGRSRRRPGRRGCRPRVVAQAVLHRCSTAWLRQRPRYAQACNEWESARRPDGGVGLTFEEFASAHLDALLRFATALTNDRELGADLVQDVLLRAHVRWAHRRFSGGSGAHTSDG
jgi:hypothetical protein